MTLNDDYKRVNHSITCICFHLYILAFLCVDMTGGSGGMEWVVVLCLLSGEWWPGVVRVRLDGQLMSDVHLFLSSLQCACERTRGI